MGLPRQNIDKVRLALERIQRGEIRVKEDGTMFYKNGSELMSLTKKGYKKMSFRNDGKKFEVLQHRVLFAYYHGFDSLSKKLTINHIDGNRLNNSKENLEQIPMLSNLKHAHQNRLIDNRGERSPNSKLNEESVKEIISLYDQGETQRGLAKKFGVCKTTIANVVNKKSWIIEEGEAI
jgi:hypothetical protein